MDVIENKKGAYCVDFVTVHHFTKFRSHICNIGDFPPPLVVQGSKKSGINRSNHALATIATPLIHPLFQKFIIHIMNNLCGKFGCQISNLKR